MVVKDKTKSESIQAYLVELGYVVSHAPAPFTFGNAKDDFVRFDVRLPG